MWIVTGVANILRYLISRRGDSQGNQVIGEIDLFLCFGPCAQFGMAHRTLGAGHRAWHVCSLRAVLCVLRFRGVTSFARHARMLARNRRLRNLVVTRDTRGTRPMDDRP